MTGKIGKRRARNAAAQLEIDRATVARRLSGGAAQRTTLRLPFRKMITPFDAHPAAERRNARLPREPTT